MKMLTQLENTQHYYKCDLSALSPKAKRKVTHIRFTLNYRTSTKALNK